jgi:hypothetical protein
VTSSGWVIEMMARRLARFPHKAEVRRFLDGSGGNVAWGAVAHVLRSLFVASLVCAAACATPDPRFVTPEATVETLLDTYRIADVPEAVVRERLAGRGNFTLADETTFRACFSDHRGPFDDGAAGYVLGRIAAAKEHLTYTPTEGGRIRVTTVRAGETDLLAVLAPTEDGYRIALGMSVPREVRAQLREVYRRRSEQLARRGVRG